ncbi:MAG: CDP-alcohol phosphatidyltransferase family protein [Gammaproteobacteria bacterium]|nr:CDP-alcohol phosphatidyltransferase family protein [Gammaproteobacteria bacterium]
MNLLLDKMNQALLTIPNQLSLFRLIAAPFLLYLAWIGEANIFLILLAISLVSDALDGFLARRWHQESELGTKLDSWGDLANYFLVPICAWWLWPEIIRREFLIFWLVVANFSVPLLVGLVKFHQIPSYHTWSAKFAAVLMVPAIYLLFLEITPWPFRIAAMIQLLMALEEIAITLYLKDLESNVKTLWHLIRKHKTQTES